MSSGSPMLNGGTGPPPSAQTQTQHDEETADEVKIFRTNDTDDGNNDEPLDDELAADKTDVAFEADIEPDSMGERSAFSSAQQNSSAAESVDLRTMQQARAFFSQMALPSPNYQFILPILKMQMSPFSSLSPICQNPLAASLAAANLINSPLYNAAAAALSTGAFGAAATAANPFGIPFGSAPVLQPVISAATSGNMPTFGNLPTSSAVSNASMRIPPGTPSSTGLNLGSLNSPVSSMSAGLNGMSLLERGQHSHKSVYKSAHTTPKRTNPYGVSSAPGSATTSGHVHATDGSLKTPKRDKASREEKNNHIKKPCNAFMWYMKMNRQRLLAEEGGQQIQSATINRRLGEEWQKMDKEEQQKYFKMAADEREEHQRRHPDWTARDNYAVKKNKKKKLREKSTENNDQKKCRARYGVENQAMWCKHCKRKKRCLNVAREVESPSHVTSTTNPIGMSSGTMASGNHVKTESTGIPRPTPLPPQHKTQQMIRPLHQNTSAVTNGAAQHISSSSSTASSSTISRHLDSPSSSGVMSVGKRTESNSSSNFESNTPPPGSNSTGSSFSQGLASSAYSQHPFTQFANAIMSNSLVTPKAEAPNSFLNGLGSANSTPLASNSAALSAVLRSRFQQENGAVEIPKPADFLALQQIQQQQQFFNSFNFGAASNQQQQQQSLMAAYAAAAFSPHNNFFK